MKHTKNKQNQGFTLIELLVVISIISLLSSVVLASLSQARLKARKSAFVQTQLNLRNAMEIYRSTEGRYPLEDTGHTSLLFEDTDGNKISGVDALVPELIAKKALLTNFKQNTRGFGSVFLGYGTSQAGMDFYEYKGGARHLSLWRSSI